MSNAHRIEVGIKPGFPDPPGEKIARSARELGFKAVESVRTLSVYTLECQGGLSGEELAELAINVFSDAVVNDYSIDAPLAKQGGFDCAVEVGFKPGVTDNVGKTARQAVKDALGRDAEAFYSRQYLFSGSKLSLEDAEKIASSLLANGLIERWEVRSSRDWTGFPALVPRAGSNAEAVVREVHLAGADDRKLAELSKDGLLALSVEEMKAIQDYFAKPSVVEQRKKAGLAANPTDAELEALAQTWSEHCKHKIFNAVIDYDDGAGGKEKIDSLFKSYIVKSTKEIGLEKKFLVSVFSDNAGIIEFEKGWNIAVKVETHNSPSALDPYGGALTGIVGVNRDVLGAGLGAKPIFNTDVFCFAPPDYPKQLPAPFMQPKRVFEGVRKGVQDGGNKSGIPTVNGSIVFDERFAYRPLVYCGTCGLMPATVNGVPSHLKTAKDGDLIVMAGGRIGKDGIHGATFSSIELTSDSPTSAVQIGDPITQKKMLDFLLEARDAGLYTAVTDNGAGGLSSSVGEMAQLSGGFELHLDRAPLKYPGLQPWEILVSESQERMTFAVPPGRLPALKELADKHEVELAELGTFTSSGKYHVLYKGRPVAFLDLAFVHGGVPRMKLKARLAPRKLVEPVFAEPKDLTPVLFKLLSRFNICSKEYVVRQYDHEVQGCSVVKPLSGRDDDGPSDAGVVRPMLGSTAGIVVSNGICPKYGDVDAYAMAANAVDEAVRNCVAAGGDPDYAAGLDNFCWCDPLPSPSNPDAEHRLAQLVRANQALYDLTTAYGVPCISGKDSMKNDAFVKGERRSIPPTLLFTVVGKVEDVSRAVTMDAKAEGDLVYVVGITGNELGGSEYYALRGELGSKAPVVNAKEAIAEYRSLHSAIASGLVASCHDCSDGGLGVALAETAFAGGLGLVVDLAGAPRSRDVARSDALLFSESASRFVVTVSPKHSAAFEKAMAGCAFGKVGVVSGSRLVIKGIDGKAVVDSGIGELKGSWKKPLDW